ncbi:Phosphate:acyl-ACP acyltransferase PlsX (EC 2.3.1.n2) [hydrothermal vent metagenome]|uniref:phosphate acyltransferase n=1 Tax=hydrothermal vent metagenome TaxID=652676 RepID=A0A3B1CJN4_9ZZZZ
MKIAVDAMGGDDAPAAIVEGAVLAAREYDVAPILVGDEAEIKKALSIHNVMGLPISVVHASQRVEMHEAPSLAIRKKKDSSISVATGLVKSGEAVAVISAGNTGASMATGLLYLRPLSCVERPAIATPLPTLKGTAIMIDVGANVDCKPTHLFQFAIMGSIYAEEIFGIVNPKVGLLSIGEEESKGNELTKEVFKMLKQSRLNFVGNVEGRDVYSGEVDVIVCDGFTGNVALKISEGLSEAMRQFLKQEILASTLGKIGYALLGSSFARFKKKVDYAEYGGAPLLGLDGVSIICHGRSSPEAIKNAIRVAKESYRRGVARHIKEQIEAHMNQVS